MLLCKRREGVLGTILGHANRGVTGISQGATVYMTFCDAWMMMI
jgi:hypothetical protein